MRIRVFALFVVIFAGWLWLDARAQQNLAAQNMVVSGAHRFEKVSEGIYYATSSGTMNVGSNSPIFVNDNEALIVDSEITPAAARALVADLKAITGKPIGYVVDSHYHYDHAHGNQVFSPTSRSSATTTRYMRMLTNVMEQYTYLTSVAPCRHASRRSSSASPRKPIRSRKRRSSARSRPPGVSRGGEGDRGHAAEPDVPKPDDALSRRPRDSDPLLSVAATPTRTSSSSCRRSALSPPAI